MGKRTKSGSTISELGSEVESKRAKNKKNKPECSDADNVSKTDEAITSKDKHVKRKNNSKPHIIESDNVKKNKKIIFNEDDEPVEVEDRSIQQKPNQEEYSHENEEDIKDEDINKFCDELNEEDNKQYEDWVKLIEAKLNSNKKKAK